MSFVASEFLGVALKYLGEKAGDAVVEHICGSLVDSLFGGDDNSEADADILAKLDQILTGLQQVQDSLQQIEGAIAQVDADINAAVIQQNVSSINSLHDRYFDCLKGLATAAKATDATSKDKCVSFRARLLELSVDAKTTIPGALGTIHDFLAGQGASSYLSKEVKVSIASATDIIDFYSKMKLPLMKVVVAELKGVHLLRFASSNPDPAVNFPDGPAAIARVLNNIDIQDQTLKRLFGPEEYEVVSSILTAYPKPAPASISLVEARGLINGDTIGDSVWYGGQTAQLWYVEPANAGPIITDGSKANGFRLMNASNNAYISISVMRMLSLHIYSLASTNSASDAAVWTLHLDSDYNFHLQPQAYPDKVLKVDIRYTSDNQSRFYIHIADAPPPPARDSYSFILQPYQGSLGNFWPRKSTAMKVGEILIPGVYLESPSKAYRLTFEGEGFGVWDVNNKIWKWQVMNTQNMSTNSPQAVFHSTKGLALCQGGRTVLQWGLQPSSSPDNDATIVVTDQGVLQFIRGDGTVSWSSNS